MEFGTANMKCQMKKEGWVLPTKKCRVGIAHQSSHHGQAALAHAAHSRVIVHESRGTACPVFDPAFGSEAQARREAQTRRELVAGSTQHFFRGLTLIEVLLSSIILAIAAGSVSMAFVAGTSAVEVSARYQMATMLARNLIEEIKLQPNYDRGRYDQDEIRLDPAPLDFREDDDCPPVPADARNCFNDKTDYHGYADGTGATDSFVSRWGNPIALFAKPGPVPNMYRQVTVVESNLGPRDDPLLEVHVAVYEGIYGDAEEDGKLVHLIRIF